MPVNLTILAFSVDFLFTFVPSRMLAAVFFALGVQVVQKHGLSA